MSFVMQVIESYAVAYPDPIKLGEGETVKIEKWEPKDSEWAGWAFCVDQRGIKGWASEKYLRVDGDSATVTRSYDATELATQRGEAVTVHREELGWAWVENRKGAQGWVPLKTLERPTLEVAKQFATLMDQNEYHEAGRLMSSACRYLYQGKVIEGIKEILKLYIDNYEIAQKELDEIQFSSEVEPTAEPGLFTLKYLDRVRRGSSWFEHRCEQKIKIVDGKVVQIEHHDLPGEPEKLQEWREQVGIIRQQKVSP